MTGAQQGLAEATAEKVAAAMAFERTLQNDEADLDDIRICLYSVSYERIVLESTLHLATCRLAASNGSLVLMGMFMFAAAH